MSGNIGIGSWIVRRARMHPERTALVFGAQRWSYRELAARVVRVAHALSARGVRLGDRVAYLGHNHPAALETLFACGLLGAVWVPVHPGFEDDAIAGMLERAEPTVLVSGPGLGAKVERVRRPVPTARVLEVTDDANQPSSYEAALAEAADTPIDRAVGLDDLAILAFSSGTTGASKGVVLTHGNLLFNALNVGSALALRRDDTLLASAPLYRMGGLGFLLPVWREGGAVVLVREDGEQDSLATIARHRVTILFDTVPAFERMRRAPSFASADLSSLRVCMTGGSPVSEDLLRAFGARGVDLRQGYGLTEAAPVVLISDHDDAPTATSAGRPPMFTEIRIVDAALADLPAGCAGELLVRGPQVSPGYWRAPEATARAFAPGGWLRTGDVAVADDAGRISILGRLADTLVLDGAPVHPGPLEAELSASCVADCALVQPRAEDRPVLFVAWGARPSAHDRVLEVVHAHLGTRWAPAVREMDAVPRNANGKVLRASLRALAGA